MNDDEAPQPPTIIAPSGSRGAPAPSLDQQGAGAPPLLAQDNYVMGEEIARGGMGCIMEAEDRKLRRTVAIKLMLFDTNADAAMQQRFLREAEVLALLAHPNIVPVHDIVWDDGVPLFYTMKRVNGRTLQAILHDLRKEDAAALRDFTLDRLLLVFRKVCDAIAFAHSKGIIHRDLKPENIMIGEFGEVLVMDWGLAKMARESDQSSVISDQSEHASAVNTDHRSPITDHSPLHTLQGSVMGTPQYMSPEQARGEIDALDERSDIFSLGGILYAILTLRPPVEGATLEEVLKKVTSAQITAPTALASTTGKGQAVQKGDVLDAKLIKPLPHTPGGRVPAALSSVAMKALRLEKAQRYQDVAALSADIEAYQTGFATSAEQAGAWKQLTLLIKRHKAASLGLAAVLLVGTTFGTKAVIEGKRAEREAVRARSEAERAERGEAAAKATLADLRRTAPIFFAQAKIVLEEGDLEDALEKIGYAIQLDDENADYHLFRAHLRQSAQDLAPAAEGYRRVLALRPEDASAKLNLALCEKLLRESGGAPLQIEQQRQLLTALRKQKRLIESAPLAALIDPNTATAKAAIIARLREYQKQPGFGPNGAVRALPDGTFKVDLYGLAIGDLSVLRGQPVSELNLGGTSITDLSSLAGLPLKDLNLGQTKVSDLSPLRGMPLESLDLRFTRVTDLSPLRGMKLRILNLFGTGVSDLSPLAGMPLTDLECSDAKSIADLAPLKGAPLVSFKIRGASRVSSLAPLAGAPLKVLSIFEIPVSDLSPLAQCHGLEELSLMRLPVTDLTPLARLPITRLGCDDLPKLTDLGPLRGMPLRYLRLSRTGVTDLRPLADCPKLEELVLPAGSLDLTPLRHLPKLRRLSTRSVGQSLTPAQTTEEFWKEYDAQPKPAGK